MEPDELTLSDIHVYVPYSEQKNRQTKDYKVVVSRFPIRSVKCDSGEESGVKEDEDGDLIVSRSPSKQFCDVIYIEHTLSTRLSDVGLQVWQGCLLLCDYIMDNKDVFSDQHVLELGAGVGLASVTAAITAQTVLCTDVGDNVLQICENNAEVNKNMYCHNGTLDFGTRQTVIRIKELDWTKEEFCMDEKLSRYHWRQEDIELLNKVRTVIAADVIYDDDLTDGFFKTFYRIMTQYNAKAVIIALERRLNFTIESLDVSCPAYTYFRQCVTQLCQPDHKGRIRFIATQINTTSLPQYFQYNRTKYLELWRILKTEDRQMSD